MTKSQSFTKFSEITVKASSLRTLSLLPGAKGTSQELRQLLLRPNFKTPKVSSNFTLPKSTPCRLSKPVHQKNPTKTYIASK
jgi:hypothetical protein